MFKEVLGLLLNIFLNLNLNKNNKLQLPKAQLLIKIAKTLKKIAAL